MTVATRCIEARCADPTWALASAIRGKARAAHQLQKSVSIAHVIGDAPPVSFISQLPRRCWALLLLLSWNGFACRPVISHLLPVCSPATCLFIGSTRQIEWLAPTLGRVGPQASNNAHSSDNPEPMFPDSPAATRATGKPEKEEDAVPSEDAASCLAIVRG